MLLEDNWYVGAWSAELEPSAMVARRICNQALVLFRTETGAVAALEDRCIHRGMPLSQGGECEGQIIRCPYHGLEFNGKAFAQRSLARTKSRPRRGSFHSRSSSVTR
jgi:phenylpropionate dioxygenase-like ring-hydroxylating dioxygenase large terminal subunit